MGRIVLCAVMGISLTAIGIATWATDDAGPVTFIPLAGMILFAVLMFASVVIMRSEILQDEAGDVELRLRPYCRKRIPASSILSVEPTDHWSHASGGYGYVLLGGGARGLLTGSPTVTIRTTERTWVVTAKDQHAVIESLKLPLESA